MIIKDKLLKELSSLDEDIKTLIENKQNITKLQIEMFLKNLEKHRYNILSEINIYNNVVEYNTEKIKNISDDYKVEVKEDILKIYIPEVMPSYKNLKTHAYKNILLNIKEITKPYANMFKDGVCLYIKIFDNIKGWDIDNKFIKPISDALILSGVIPDDNIDNMFYIVKGKYSTNPHTEVCVCSIENMSDF